MESRQLQYCDTQIVVYSLEFITVSIIRNVPRKVQFLNFAPKTG